MKIAIAATFSAALLLHATHEVTAGRTSDDGIHDLFYIDGHTHGRGASFFGKHGIDFPNLDLANITCDAPLACNLYHGNAQGVFVCRTEFHPITGANQTMPVCIPADAAWDMDACGCCGDDCPIQPDFIDSTCDGLPSRHLQRRGDSDEGSRRSRHSASRDRDLDVVCREVFNPFSGDAINKTIEIHDTRGLEGDVCGCCNGTCPVDSDEGSDDADDFEKPALVNATCAVEEVITCTLPKRHGGNKNHRRRSESRSVSGSDDSDDSGSDGSASESQSASDDGSDSDDDDDMEATQGLFMCRETFDPLTGESHTMSVCVAADATWESDTCGCCGDDCPVRIEDQFANSTCVDDDIVSCDLHSGEQGQFVCRPFFNPQTGDVLMSGSVCIPSGKSLPNDACGCCSDTGCPTTPNGGFDDDGTVQLMQMLESSNEAGAGTTLTASTNTDDSSAASISAMGLMAGTVLSSMVAITFA